MVAGEDSGEHQGPGRSGELIRLSVDGRRAFLIAPDDPVDSERRWIWTAPAWLAMNTGTEPTWPERGPWPRESHAISHTFYVAEALSAGYYIAGVDVGTTCGSPAGAVVSHHLYERLVREYDLNPLARLVAQSNGGLIHYSWAIAHPGCVDRVFGIFPVTDMRSWPGLEKVCGPGSLPSPGLGYDLSVEELTARLTEFNPIDRVPPLAAHGVKILHIHGDSDELVPLEPNSAEFARRYRDLGGEIDVEVVPGGIHAGLPPFYEAQRAVEFILG